MDCPHCGGFVDTRGAKPLQHPCFDDATRRIVVDGAGRRLVPGEWRILSALRERFRRFVPSGFLAQISARDPLDGGNENSVRVRINLIRPQLDARRSRSPLPGMLVTACSRPTRSSSKNACSAAGCSGWRPRRATPRGCELRCAGGRGQGMGVSPGQPAPASNRDGPTRAESRN